MTQAQSQPRTSTAPDPGVSPRASIRRPTLTEAQTRLRPDTRNAPAAISQMLPGLPRTGLTPQQQLEALNRVRSQAEQRVRLGLQLFKAAEAHTSNHRQMLEQITAERKKFRDELAQDVTGSLHDFDQRIGQKEDTFNQAMLTLEERINALESRLDASSAKVQAALDQSSKLLEQALARLDGEDQGPTVRPTPDQPLSKHKPEVVSTPRPEDLMSATQPSASSPPEEAPRPDIHTSVSYSEILDRIAQGRQSRNPGL